MGQQGFWDVDERLEKLAGKQDILNRLNVLVPWETFRPILSRIHEKPRKSKAGRKPIDIILTFKMLVLSLFHHFKPKAW